MVTTRGQSGQKPIDQKDEDSTAEDKDPGPLSGGLNKRQRSQPEDEPKTGDHQDRAIASPTRKRQKILALRSRDEEPFEIHSHIEVVIPVKDISSEKINKSLASIRGSLEGQDVPAERCDENSLVETKEVSGKGIDSNSPTIKSIQGNLKTQGTSISRPNKSGSKTEVLKNKLTSFSPSPSAMARPNSTKPKHKKFGSEEPWLEGLENILEQHSDVAENEEDSSDDDAPEVVATHDAYEKALLSTRNASKAVEERDAVIRQKRKERDAQLKEQAKTAKKRKNLEDFDKPRGPVEKDKEDSHTFPTDVKLDGNQRLRETSSATKSKSTPKISASNLPEFLPLEYFEDDDRPASDPSIIQKSSQASKPKKTKFFDPIPKKPKDRTKGSTTYRVAEARGDGMLAPKAVSNARSIKDAWLKGRNGGKRGGGGGLERRVVRKSFLVKS